jgi:hypothetical protein
MLQTIIFPADFYRAQKLKNRLVPDAEVPAAKMVFREEFAGRAKSTGSLTFVADEVPHPQKSSVGWYFSRE